jgi:hypothetical protein
MFNQLLFELLQELIIIRLLGDVLKGHGILGWEQFESIILVTAINCFILFFPF